MRRCGVWVRIRRPRSYCVRNLITRQVKRVLWMINRSAVFRICRRNTSNQLEDRSPLLRDNTFVENIRSSSRRWRTSMHPTHVPRRSSYDWDVLDGEFLELCAGSKFTAKKVYLAGDLLRNGIKRSRFFAAFSAIDIGAERYHRCELCRYPRIVPGGTRCSLLTKSSSGGNRTGGVNCTVEWAARHGSKSLRGTS
jgi:hypothetical protein